MRAEAAGDPGPWRQQALLDRRDWDADALRDIVRDYVIDHLVNDDAVLVNPARSAHNPECPSCNSCWNWLYRGRLNPLCPGIAVLDEHEPYEGSQPVTDVETGLA